MIRKLTAEEEKFVKDVIWDWDKAREIVEKATKK